MQKVYLLLRSNKQTGPYSLEELLQLNLKPFDLVWVEGRSAAWQYPFEIPSLKPYVAETPQAAVPFQPIATSAMEEKLFQNTDPGPVQQNPIPSKTDNPKRVFVSVPKTYNATNRQTDFSEQQNAFAPKPQHLDERKEDVKVPVAAYSQSMPLHPQQTPVEEETHTNYSRSLNEVEEDYTNWMYKKKTKKKVPVNPKDLVLAVLILAVIGGGYYVMSKPSVTNSVLPASKTAAQTNLQPAENNTEATGSEEKVSSEQKAAPGANDISVTNEPKSKTIKTKNPLPVTRNQTNSSVPPVPNSMPGEKTNSNIHDGDKDITVKEPEVKQQSKENVPTEKKKKFGEVIKGIFSKKEKKEEPTKNDETVLEDPKPANNRQATRREGDNNAPNDNPVSNEVSTASLMEQVEILSNAPGNWMMGVRNLKVILKNRSGVTIQAASVAVNYYDENNQLLEKKLIYFSNIAPKAKATMAAPDHKFADHVDFRLISATAKEDRYARY